MRYKLRKFETGWAVWDTTTDAPALVDGSFQEGMLMNDAKNLTDLLNQLVDRGQPGSWSLFLRGQEK